MNNNEKKSFMEMINHLGKWLEIPKAYILIPERVKILEETCRKLQELIDEENLDSKLIVKPCPLGFGDVSVSFDAYSFTIRNMTKFYAAVRHLDNFEVYAAENEMIHFAGIFSKVAAVAPLNPNDKKNL